MVVDSAEEEQISDIPAAELIPPVSPVDRPPLITTSLSPPWPMVSISKYQNNNNPPIIFLPANHENLNICPDPPPHVHSDSYSSSDSGSVSDSDSGSVSTFSPSASISPLFSSHKASPVADVSSRFDSWIETLRSNFYSAVRYLWSSNISSSQSALLTLRSAAAMALVVLGLLYFRQRRRLKTEKNSRRRLIRIVDEKEEKINQLLDQVSRMNQVLLSLHKAPTPT